MKLQRYVKPMPFPLGILYKGIAFHDFVLIRKKIIDNLKSKYPDPQNVGVLFHELEHYKRIRKYGNWKFGWKYWINSRFRFQEEIAANIPQMKYLKKNREKFNIEK